MKIEVVTRENRHLYTDHIEQMFDLRHRIFVERLHWEGLRKPDGREIDEFDNGDAIYLLVTQGETVCGCHRMIPTTKPHLISEVFADFCDVRGILRGPKVIECGRTCVDEDRLSRSDLRAARRVLMTGLMEFCERIGASHFTGINPVNVMSHYLRLDWDIRPLGIPRKMEDGTTYVAVSYAVSKEALASARKVYGIKGDVVEYRGADTPLCHLLEEESPSKRGDGNRFRLTEAEVDEFEHNGVIVLRNAITQDDISRLRGALDDLAGNFMQSSAGYDVTALRTAIFDSGDTKPAAGDATQYDMDTLAGVIASSGKKALVDAIDGPAEGHFILDTSTWLRSESVRKLALDSELPQIAAALLRSFKVNFCDDQIFVKPPFTRDRTAVHQDYTYFHVAGEQGCVMWICVDEADARSGAPFYVRGSHRWGRHFAPNVFMSQTRFPGSEGEDLDQIESQPSKYDVVSFETRPGDIIVHHFKTVHGAGGNLSNRPRRALSLRYAGDDMRFHHRIGAPPQPYHRHSLSNGDALDSEQFPMVWPRPFPRFSLAPFYESRE